jgi:putative ABC transport system permease protein
MKPREFLRTAWESIRKNKLRSFLTMLGIIIGTASVIIMVAVSAGTERQITEQITSLGSNLIFLTSSFSRGGPMAMVGSSSTGLVYDDAQAIAQGIKGVAGVIVEQGATQSVRAGSVSLGDVEVVGTTPDFPNVRDVEVASGRFLTSTDVESKSKVAILGSGLAQQLFGTSDPIGQTVTVGTTKLSVVGVMAPKGSVGGTDFDNRLYTPITVVFQKFSSFGFGRVTGDRVRAITVALAQGQDLKATVQQIEYLLCKRHGVSIDSMDFSVTTQDDIISARESTTASFRSLLSWVAGVSLIVGGIGIMNIMLVSVTERTREIGIRQSVGASPTDIRWQFLTESLLLSLVGGAVGVVAGIGGSYLFAAVGDMPTSLVPASVLLAFASAAAVGVFFGFYPANRAAQLDPIQALRHE